MVFADVADAGQLEWAKEWKGREPQVVFRSGFVGELKSRA